MADQPSEIAIPRAMPLVWLKMLLSIYEKFTYICLFVWLQTTQKDCTSVQGAAVHQQAVRDPCAAGFFSCSSNPETRHKLYFTSVYTVPGLSNSIGKVR